MTNNMLHGSETAKNLESAFAGESMANRRYLYFAKLARELGNEEVAALFEDIAGQETGHAFAHLQLIYPKEGMTVEKLLEIARDGELYETNQMYPDFEKQALQEGNAAAVAEFKEQAEESKQHAAIFNKAAMRFGAFRRIEALHANEYNEALQKVKSGQSISQAS